MKVYTVYRTIVAMNQTCTLIPLKVFAKKEDADAAVNEINQEYSALFGPNSNTQLVVNGKPLPVRLPDFLVELGIQTVRHHIGMNEVHDSLIVQPRAGLIIPS